MHQETVHLLDTTLRDGSYEIGFQFSSEDVALLVSALDRAGVRYIELCHGNGFAFDRWSNWPEPRLRAALSDEAYLDVASSVVENASIGAVYVVEPQLLPMDNLKLLTDHGADFVRLMFLPTNIDEHAALAHIDRAKDLGLTVSVNLTQTYALTVSEVVKGAIECKRRGADWFYIVDSAGGMTPTEVASYVKAVKEATGLTVGLHAHNNSGLGIANCLAAVEAGATRVDGTLQGVGRNTGNPATEQLVLTLQRLGYEQAIDSELVCNMGDLIRTILIERGNDPTDYVFGSVRLPWRQVPKLMKVAEERGRAPREFLRNVGAEAAKRGILSHRQYPSDLIDQITAATRAAGALTPTDAVVDAVASCMARASMSELGAITDDLRARASKRNKRAVLHVAPQGALAHARPLPWEDGDYVGVTVGASDWASIAPDRYPSIVLADPSVTLPELPPATRVYREAFERLEAEAACDLAQAAGLPVLVLTSAAPLREVLTARGLVPDNDRRGRSVVLTDARSGWASAQRDDIVVLLGTEAIPDEQVGHARENGVRLLRPPIGPAAAARIAVLERARMTLAGADTQTLGSLTLAAPTTVAQASEVVVDDLSQPTRVLDDGRHPVATVSRTLGEARAKRLYIGRGSL